MVSLKDMNGLRRHVYLQGLHTKNYWVNFNPNLGQSCTRYWVNIALTQYWVNFTLSWV